MRLLVPASSNGGYRSRKHTKLGASSLSPPLAARHLSLPPTKKTELWFSPATQFLLFVPTLKCYFMHINQI